MKSVSINIAVFFIISVFNLPASSAEFGPWMKDVRTGDDNIIISAHAQTADSHKKKPVVKLYNGPQTGAFLLIRFFQVCISPQDGPNCRFDPVCSVYARQAVERFGAFLGAVMAGERLIRCNPYYPPGKDPVPEKLTGGN